MELPPYTTLLWIMPLAYTAHIAEEYFFDWRSWASGLSRLDLTWKQFRAVNAGFYVFALLAASVGSRSPAFSLSLPALALINALFFHFLPTVVFRRYSPGVVTACIVVLPVAALTYLAAYQANVLSLFVLWVSSVSGLAVMALPVVLLRWK